MWKCGGADTASQYCVISLQMSGNCLVGDFSKYLKLNIFMRVIESTRIKQTAYLCNHLFCYRRA